MTEYFEVIDENENVLRLAKREECHSNPALLHKCACVFITRGGKFLLQQRSAKLDTQPLKWDMLAEHVKPGEGWREAAKRGLREELGISLPLKFAARFVLHMRNESELEYIYTASLGNKKVKINREEIAQCKFFTQEEVENLIAGGKTAAWFSRFFEIVKAR